MDVRAVGEHWNPAACELADPLRRPRPAELDYREIASGLVPGHIRPGGGHYRAKLRAEQQVPSLEQDALSHGHEGHSVGAQHAAPLHHPFRFSASKVTSRSAGTRSCFRVSRWGTVTL